jgi:hypothetical protein
LSIQAEAWGGVFIVADQGGDCVLVRGNQAPIREIRTIEPTRGEYRWPFQYRGLISGPIISTCRQEAFIESRNKFEKSWKFLKVPNAAFRTVCS